MKRKTGLSRKRKGKSASLTRQLDIVWSQVVRKEGRCEHCGRSNRKLDAHHIFGRGNFRVRFEPRNGVALCGWECHRQWAHNNPTEFTDWIRAARPDDVRYVEQIKNEVSHYSDKDKAEMLEELKAKL